MAGLCMGMILMPHAMPQTTPFVKKVRIIGTVMILVYLAILLPVFYTSIYPTKTFYARIADSN